MTSDQQDCVKEKKIKVLQLGSPSGLYGAEHWILSLVKYLDPARVESQIGSIKEATDHEVPICVEASKLGYPTHLIEADGKFSFSAVRNLHRTLEENDIDILHTHGYKTDLIGLLATRNSRCKILSTPHGWTQQPGVKLWLYESINRLIFPFLDVVAPLSKGILEPLKRIPGLGKKLCLISNGVDIEGIEQTDEIAEEIQSVKRTGAFVIGYIGRLVPGKGLDVLLKAVAEHGESNWNVMIVGEGEMSSQLESLATALDIRHRVHFLGFRSDRLAFLNGFDVFVLPSRSEGIPRCLMEAMSASIPVIASDIPGCRNLIDGETTGLLFEMDNHQALSRCIYRMKSDREMRQLMIDQGKALVRENFSAAQMANRYEKLYRSMMSSRSH